MDVPPVADQYQQGPVGPQQQQPKNPFQKAWGGLMAAIAATWKFVLPVLKFAKLGKILLTMGSMFVSVAFYSLLYGWKFAVGFVICILIHEMGHVFAAWRLKMPVSAPIFIPGMGALILSKQMGKSGFESGIMGIGGPIFGAFAAFGCWGLYSATGNPLFLGLAYVGFFMNLFNMTPIFPLDGGWIAGAISPYIWIVGLVILVGMTVMGIMTNPFIWVLVILSIPRIIGALKKKSLDEPGGQTTSMQRYSLGVAYVSLCAVLVFGMSQTLQQSQVVEQSHRPAASVQ